MALGLSRRVRCVELLNFLQRVVVAVVGGEERRHPVDMAVLALAVAGIRNKKCQRQH